MITKFTPEGEPSWIDKYIELDNLYLYITSFYFTVTTITTVGYGDISGVSNNIERIFCSFIMITGVISFSFASGSLASILQNYDTQNAKITEKMTTLNKIKDEHDLPMDFFVRLKKAVSHSNSGDVEEIT
jgi:hypothetical protein